MRLTLIIPIFSPGGAERVMAIMANYWASQGVPVIVLTFDSGREEPFYPLDPRMVHRPIGLAESRGFLRAAVNFPRNIYRIRKAIRASRPEVAISFMESTNVMTLMATLGTGIPVVVSERCAPLQNPIGKTWKVLRYVTYRWARMLVAQTERSCEYFRPWMNGKLAVIANPVIVPIEGSDENFFISEYSILSIGRLVPQKGFDLLIEAFSKISLQHPQWELVIFGSGALLAELKKQAADLGLQDKIRFPGKVNNSYSVLKKAKIYVSASRFEGFPNALCEAMASGLPVIATDCPDGPREIITDGMDGVLVPNEDVAAIAGALEKLMDDEPLRARLGTEALKITDRFSVEAVMGKWEKVVEPYVKSIR